MRKPHQHHPKPRAIVEFGVEVTDGQIRRIETFLRSQKIAFYVLPPAEPPYATLEELKADCEDEEDPIKTTAAGDEDILKKVKADVDSFYGTRETAGDAVEGPLEASRRMLSSIRKCNCDTGMRSGGQAHDDWCGGPPPPDR